MMKSYDKSTAVKTAFKMRKQICVISVLLLVLFALPVSLAQAQTPATTQRAAAYPKTPVEVVKAWQLMEYEGCPIFGEEGCSHKELYDLYDDFFPAGQEPQCRADYAVIVSSFKVRPVLKKRDRAVIQVTFDVVGTLADGYLDQPVEIDEIWLKPQRENFESLSMINGMYKGTISYNMVREKNSWKILHEGCVLTYLSVEAAVKYMEEKQGNIKEKSFLRRNQKIIDYLKSLRAIK